jgi:hypothetical protein
MLSAAALLGLRFEGCVVLRRPSDGGAGAESAAETPVGGGEEHSAAAVADAEGPGPGEARPTGDGGDDGSGGGEGVGAGVDFLNLLPDEGVSAVATEEMPANASITQTT